MKVIVSFLFLSISFFSFSQSLEILNTNPIPQTLSTEPNHTIVFTLNQSVNPATITKDSFMVFGRWSGPMEGTYVLSNNNTVVTFTPQRDFFFGEWVSVRLTSFIKTMNEVPLTNGFGYNYWTKTIPSASNLTLLNQFSTKQNGESLIQSYGAYAGDVNDDEFTDLVVVAETANDIRVLLNDGTGNYDPSEMNIINMPNANKPSTNDCADYNHDGIIDLAIGSTQNDNVSLFMGNTTTTFDPEQGLTADTGVRGLVTIDVNGDGWDDIATANRSGSSYSILINDGTGNFGEPTTINSNLNGETSIAAADVNNDGIMDLIIGGFQSKNVSTFINDGEGNFTQKDTVSLSGRPWMIAAGDINGDGNVDFVSANSSNGEVSVITGDGDGNLSLLGEYPSGEFTLSIKLGDIDGDGDLDFVASNYQSSNFTLYKNNGSGAFSNPVKFPTTGAGSCAIFHDRNNDGAMDLTLIDEVDDIVYLYENEPVTAGVDDLDLTSSLVYPNPFSEIIHLKEIPKGVFNFKLIDLQGRIVFQKEGIETASINTSQLGLNNGAYILEISHDSRVFTQLLIKK